MIKNIVFDMGNVLILYDAQRILNSYGENPEDNTLLIQNVFHSVEWIQLDRGTLSQEQAIWSICQRLPERLHPTVQRLLESWHEDIPPFPEMEKLAARLKAAGYGVYLLSNTSKKYHSFRRHIPALQYFQGEFISADWGLLKPDPAIYRAFCSHFGLVPAQCFFVDDMPANLEGAMLIGMAGTVFHGDVALLEQALRQAGVTF